MVVDGMVVSLVVGYRTCPGGSWMLIVLHGDVDYIVRLVVDSDWQRTKNCREYNGTMI